jgi:RsiW-degrading membrane proteinase PrsW (M82 family)
MAANTVYSILTQGASLGYTKFERDLYSVNYCLEHGVNHGIDAMTGDTSEDNIGHMITRAAMALAIKEGVVKRYAYKEV